MPLSNQQGFMPFHGRKVTMSFYKFLLALCAVVAFAGCQDGHVDVYVHEATGCQSDEDCDEAYGDSTIASCITETGACRYVTTNVVEVEAHPCVRDAECADDNPSSADTCEEGVCTHTVRLGGVSTIVFGTQRMYGEHTAPYVSWSPLSSTSTEPQLAATVQIINGSGTEFTIDELDFGASTVFGQCSEVTAYFRYFTEFVHSPIGLVMDGNLMFLEEVLEIPENEMVWFNVYCTVDATNWTEPAEAIIFAPRWEWNPDIPVFTDNAPAVVYIN